MTALSPAERHFYIGASESAALPGIGCSPYSTPFELFHLKKASFPPEDLDDVERIQAGQFLEDGIARWGAHRFGMEIKPVNEYIIHKTIHGMGASLDRLGAANDDADGLVPVEIKNVDGFIFKKEWESEGDIITHAPIHILIQVQHQLAVQPEAPYAWLIALVGGNEIKRMKVERHPNTIARVEKAVAAFWGSVKADEPPPIDWEADAETIAKLYSEAGVEVVDMKNDKELAICAHGYLLAKEEAKVANATVKGLKARMLPMIGDAGKVIGNGFNISAGVVNRKEYTVQPTSYRNFKLTAKKED